VLACLVWGLSPITLGRLSEVSIPFEDRRALDRPILDLTRIEITSARFRLVPPDTDGAIDPAHYTRFGELAGEILRQRQQGRDVTVMVNVNPT